tara:strand:- start:679 stop:3144 length:2466 start_codon:yes stop_codon:yes gene_type:complete
MTEENDTSNSHKSDDIDLDHLKNSLSGNNNGGAPSSQSKIQLLGAVTHTYDRDAVLGFIDDVLTDIPTGAHRLVYTSDTNIPKYPLGGVDELDKIMARTTAPRAMYYSLTTVYPDANGELHHKSEAFAAMHGIIFDDIGTKVDAADVPASLVPSYIIESSEGNYQWGFLFDKPLVDIEHAKSLISLISHAGLSDAGGKVPVKLVRLPEGINGKKKSEKQMFHVKLNKWTGLTYTPEQIVERIGLTDESGDITWDRIKSGYDPVAKKHNSKFLPLLPQGQSSEGTVDEVLEWLYQEGAVMAHGAGGWVEIVCPWHHKHSDGALTAGYKPLGYGDDPFQRGFNCFHDGCADKDTKDFFVHVINSSNIALIPYRVTEHLPFGDFAYDTGANEILKLVSPPIATPMVGMRTHLKRASMPAVNWEGKTKKVNPVDLWLDSPFRITVNGHGSEPGAERLYDKDGGVWLNSCVLPDWGTGAYDQTHVDRFLDYVNYLIPSVEEATFFLDWLTHKMCDPRFRGTGIIMVAQEFGVGRSTLAKMVAEMLGKVNTARVDFASLTGSPFNSWEDKLFVVVDEAEDNSSFGAKHSSYEILKQRVDTTATTATLNPKYGKAREVTVCSSYLILSNHVNAVAIPPSDRRLTVLTNTDEPESEKFFVALNDWRKNTDWAGHVFRYLAQRTTTNTCMLPLHTDAKSEMTEASENTADRCARLLSEHLQEEQIVAVGHKQANHILTSLIMMENEQTIVTSVMLKRSLNKFSVRFNVVSVRTTSGVEKPRLFSRRIRGYEKDMLKLSVKDVPESVIEPIITSCALVDPAKIIAHILAEM